MALILMRMRCLKVFVIWIYIHNEIAREDRLKKKIRRNSRYKIEQFFEKSRFF